jgi:hypothetical protein
VVSKQAEAFLSEVAPYLVIKKEQARLGLVFRKTKVNTVRKKLGVTKEETAIRESFYQAIKELNK